MPSDSFSSSASKSGSAKSTAGSPPPAAGKDGFALTPNFAATAAARQAPPVPADLPPAEIPVVPRLDNLEIVQTGTIKLQAEATDMYVDPFAPTPAAEAAPAEAAEEVYEEAVAGAAWESILQAEFLNKDRNGDGFLSMKEITIKELLELDVDHNGFISIDEFYGVFEKKSETLFLRLDLDRDGRLKLNEFTKGRPTPELEADYRRYAREPAGGLTLDEYRNYLADQRA